MLSRANVQTRIENQITAAEDELNTMREELKKQRANREYYLGEHLKGYYAGKYPDISNTVTAAITDAERRIEKIEKQLVRLNDQLLEAARIEVAQGLAKENVQAINESRSIFAPGRKP